MYVLSFHVHFNHLKNKLHIDYLQFINVSFQWCPATINIYIEIYVIDVTNTLICDLKIVLPHLLMNSSEKRFFVPYHDWI